MDELTKVRVNNLISLRQSLLVLLPILIGGTIGLIFVEQYTILRFILIGIGVFFTIVLFISLYITITELNKYLYVHNKLKRK